jgi:hypothetical protein
MSYHKEIEEVAYELYEQSGKMDGNDIDHWLEAERIVSARQTEKKAIPKTVGRKVPAAKGAAVRADSPTRAGKSARKTPDAGLS